ncbi:MAG: ABC transporter substrate-binding protein [Bacillota bacterium]
MRKIVTLLLLVCFLTALLSGCGSNNADNGEPVKLVWYLMGDKPKDFDKVMAKVNEYTKEKINCTVELKLLPWDSYQTKIESATMAGEKWDICFTSFWMLNYPRYARKGFFYPLNDLLPKEGAGVSKCLDNMPQYIEATKIGNEIFAVPVYNGAGYWQGYYFDKAKIDKYGFDLSGVKRVEDLFPLFDKVKIDYPQMVSIDNYWWMDDRDKYDFIVDSDFPGVIRVDDKNCKVINQYEDPAYMNTLKKFRMLYQKGYTFKGETDRPGGDLVRNGKVFCTVDTLGIFSNQDWSAAGKMQFVSVPVFPKPVAKSTEVALGEMMAINAQSEHPEAAMKFINLLYTDKYLMTLLCDGIEGVHYTKISSNTIKPMGGDYTLPDWLFGFKCLLPVMEGVPEDKWQKIMAADKSAIVATDFGFIPDLGPVTNEVSNIKNIVEQYVKTIKRGSVDPEIAVPEFVAKLKAGGLEKYLAEMQHQVDAWKANKK